MYDEDTGCCVWLGPLRPDGHPQRGRAARMVWEEESGVSIPDRYSLRRNCPVKCCVSTSHRFLCRPGTEREHLREGWPTKDEACALSFLIQERCLSRIVEAPRWAEDEEQGCCIWLGPISKKGYGRSYDSVEKVHKYAHRVVWEEFNGPIGPGLVLDHVVCGVRVCVNPNHLEPVSNAENARRRWAKFPDRGAPILLAA